VTDQEKIPRFADGEPIHPFGTPKHRWRTLGEIFAVWALVLGVLGGIFWLMFTLVGERRAHAQEASPRDPSVTIYEKPGECFIDIDLRVTGTKRAACVDRLETAARLAKAEQRVNERRKK
jgi:hypothetical protein